MNLRKDHCINRIHSGNQPSPSAARRPSGRPALGRRSPGWGPSGPQLGPAGASPLPVGLASVIHIQLNTPQTSTSSEATVAAGSAACPLKPKTTLNNGYLGSRIDEERSEMRYVV